MGGCDLWHIALKSLGNWPIGLMRIKTVLIVEAEAAEQERRQRCWLLSIATDPYGANKIPDSEGFGTTEWIGSSRNERTAIPQLLYPESTTIKYLFLKKKPPIMKPGRAHELWNRPNTIWPLGRNDDLENNHPES
jgi:hypothetical protein